LIRKTFKEFEWLNVAKIKIDYLFKILNTDLSNPHYITNQIHPIHLANPEKIGYIWVNHQSIIYRCKTSQKNIFIVFSAIFIAVL